METIIIVNSEDNATPMGLFLIQQNVQFSAKLLEDNFNEPQLTRDEICPICSARGIDLVIGSARKNGKNLTGHQ